MLDRGHRGSLPRGQADAPGAGACSINRVRGERQAGKLLLLTATVAALAGAPGAAAKAKTPTKAAATAFAKKVNLTTADVAGFTGKPNKTTASDQRQSEMLAKCSGGIDPRREVVDVPSLDFSLAGTGAEEVSSDVSVLPSAQLVAADLRAVKSARGRKCLTQATGRLLASMDASGVTYGTTTLTTLKRSAPGSDGSFAYRLRVNATASGVKVPFFVDSLGFASGKAEVGLTTLGIGQPFPAADEQRLFTLLAGRASFNHI
jgi:hypothetical protein